MPVLPRTTYDPVARLWSGPVVRPLYNPHASVADVAFASLGRRPAHIAQISDADGSRLSNGELHRLAVRCALNLARVERVGKGDVVAVVVHNHRLVGALVLGCFALAAPVNSLDPDFKADEIAHMLRLTRPKVVFCDADIVAAVRDGLAKVGGGAAAIPLYTVDRRVAGAKSVEDLITASDDPEEEEHFVPTDVGDGTKHPVAIICSSGTTGPSKGVSVSHALLLHQLTGIVDLADDDVFFTFSSLYWLSGLATLVISCIFGITRIVTTAPFDADLMLRIVAQYRVTTTLTAPSYLAQLLQSPNLSAEALSSLHQYICGGSAVPPELSQRIDRVLPAPLHVAYGLSEVAGLVSANRRGRPVAGSNGQLSSGMLAQVRRIAGAGDEAELCGIDENGEICVRMAQFPMLGYWADERATSEAIDADGWLHTGDVGHFDVAGNLYIVDRIKDILKYRGVQISPTELENAVLELAGVAQVCVVGVLDEVGSDLPAAVVMRQAGVEGERLSAAMVEARVAERFSDAKRLRAGVYFVERFPLTPSGKVLRREVREMVTRWWTEAQSNK